MAEMTKGQFEAEQEEHNNVLNRVTNEVKYWLEINKNDNANSSSLASYSRGIHAVFQLYMLDLTTFIRYEIGVISPYEIYVVYKGRKAVRVFIDIINMFEAQINHLYIVSAQFRDAVEAKVIPLLTSVEENWANPAKKIKNGATKADVIQLFGRKRFETSLRRRALLNLKWIGKDEFNLLEFCWWLRNCMHNDFSALSDKKFTFMDVEANEAYELNFTQGNIISIHTRIVYGLSRIIGRILYRILENANNVNATIPT